MKATKALRKKEKTFLQDGILSSIFNIRYFYAYAKKYLAR
jgi:hypothetical protein